MQEFYINKNATLPILKMELINDGRYDFQKFHEMIQDSTISFSMRNYENDTLKISNNTSNVFLEAKDGCDEEYYICYKWSERDTKQIGKFKGQFTIKFGGVLGDGKLIVPIQDELTIYVQ